MSRNLFSHIVTVVCLSNKLSLLLMVLSLHSSICKEVPMLLQCFPPSQCLLLTLHPPKDGSTQHRFLLSPLGSNIAVHVLIEKKHPESSSLLPVYVFFSQDSKRPPVHPTPPPSVLNHIVNFYGSLNISSLFADANKAICPVCR